MFLSFSLTLGLAACATAPKVRVDRADVDLSVCRTFAWLRASEDAASLTEQRVRAAALQHLENKGYTLSENEPDCWITYVLETREQPQRVPRVGAGVGGGSRGVGGGIGVSIPVGRQDRRTGEFTLDVVDASRKAQIWRGTLETTFAAEELTQEEADQAVRRVLAEFPDRGASPAS
ncbi:MAG: DUF4136 domain-containing protein [Steroidobacteraceae bacterium]|jgi:hypothetical protein|nr:DUF4136 domain-containing protein [Steroidobacteraceae bacterium]